MRAAANRLVNRQIKEDWLQDWTSSARGRSLYQIMKESSNMVLKIHNSMEKWLSALLIQMRTQKIGCPLHNRLRRET